MRGVAPEPCPGGGQVTRRRRHRAALVVVGLLFGSPQGIWSLEATPEPGEHGAAAGVADREESLSLAKSRYERGVEALRQGQLDLAAELLHDALRVQEQLAPESSAVAHSLNKLGSVTMNRGEISQAIEYFQRAIAIRVTLDPESLDVAASLNNLGVAAINQGELDLAGEYHRRALEIKQKLAPESLTVAASLNNIGLAALYRGELDLAGEVLQRALAIKERLAPESRTVAATLGGLGTLALDRGAPDEARKYLEGALAIHERLSPESLKVADTLNNLGQTAREQGELDVARDYSRRALAIQEKLVPGSLYLADTLDTLGAVALDRGQLDLAQDYFLRAFSIGEKLAPGGLSAPDILNRLGTVAWRRGELLLAAEYFERSLAALESKIGRLGGSHDARGGFRARYGHCYRDAIELLLEMDRAAAAFAVLERSRARSLLAMLAEKDLVFAADIPAELEAARRSIAERHDQIQGRILGLDPAHDEAEIETLSRELVKLRRQRDDVAAKVHRASPRLAALQYPEPVDLQGARKALDPGTVMLSYSVGEDRSQLFVVTRESGLEVHSLAIGEEQLRREVVLFREQIQAARASSEVGPGPMTFLDEVSRRLYLTLVEPAADRMAQSARVLLVPDGPLHHFPFAALIREITPDGPEAVRDGQYLAQWKPLHSVLSATLYAQLRERRRGSSDGSNLRLAAFGDPQYDPRRPRQSRADPRLRSLLDRGLDLTPLPASRREVEGIAGLYPAETTSIYLGAEATEERAKAIGRGVQVLHFATHGFLDERLPLNSGLVLTLPQEFRQDRDNGLLQAWEIFESVRLDADLVVLSACGSSLGEEQGGEGLISVTRAFQYAGARSVAATLWNVDDAVTAELMVRFYRHLKAGRSKDAALRAAQLELISEPLRVPGEDGEMREIDASAPFYWAAFQLTGDWQ